MGKSFTIRFTKQVVFRDRAGSVVKVFAPGKTIEATGQGAGYFLTAMGGIWFDEAEKVA
jgi:hypothetical protein